MNKKELQVWRKQWGFREPWLAVDLDGTLAESTSWNGYGHIGEPIPLMLMRVRGWIRQGKTVKIFTSRVEGGSPAIRSIHQWLKKHGLPKLEVTNIKDSGLVELWDDLAVKVEANTGETCCPYKKNWKVKIVY
jgi:hypothetical protein